MSAIKALHLFAFAHFAFGIYYDLNHLEFPESFHMTGTIVPLKGRMKFLTFWDMILQTVYFSIALLNDFIGSNDNVPSKVPAIRRLKDFVFSALAFPIAMYVGVSFWGLMAVDRELVFPKVLDAYFPTWLNHVMHTNIMVFIVLEMFLTFRQYPSVKRGLTTLTAFLVVYLIWVHVIFYYSGFWVYPVLQVLSWPMKIVFYLGSLGFGIVLYLTGEFLNNKIWAKQISQLKRSGKKKSN